MVDWGTSLVLIPLFSMVSNSFISLLEDKLCSSKHFFCPSICCLDFLGSNDNALLDALVYDKNYTSCQSKCYLVFFGFILMVLAFFGTPLHLP